MAKINYPKKAAPAVHTHEGAVARRAPGALAQLRRSVMACLLWEDSFYESGEDIAKRIRALVHQCPAQDVRNLAIEARTKMNLRHVPLLLARELCRHNDRTWTESCIFNVIQRADELAELVALYWKDEGDGKPLPAAMKRGLARAFNRFDAYQLAKYNRDAAVKLRDVLFLVHPKPACIEQALAWKKLANNELDSPDTWEVALSAGKNKRETFERLIAEDKLGAMALLRNLRGMTEAGVPANTVRAALANMKADRVLPFRFISAAQHAPQFEPELEAAMFKCLEGAEKLGGRTLLLVDVSGSMKDAISGKSEISRIDAANGLAILTREVCEGIDVFTFATEAKPVPARRGFALRDAIKRQFGGSTRLGAALESLKYGEGYERVIVITDEQSHDKVGSPLAKHGYILNVAAYQNGVGYGPWTTIDGWSDSCVRYISECEKVGF